MKYGFIFNPRAGPVRERGALPALLAGFIAAHRLDATVVATERRAHATDLAAAAIAAGCEVVVAIGGDGTMNEVARALVGTPAALALVPRGSGNGLARHLGIPLKSSAALAALLHFRPRSIDVGEANGRFFFCAMGTGFDTAVLAHFERLPTRGFSTYLLSAARVLASYPCETYQMVVDGAPISTTASLLVAVTNSPQLGNNAQLAPLARVDDGLLNVVVVPRVNALSAMPLLLRLFTGSLHREPRVLTRTGREIVILRRSAGPMHVDGELVETTAEIKVSVRPAGLRVLAPATK